MIAAFLHLNSWAIMAQSLPPSCALDDPCYMILAPVQLGQLFAAVGPVLVVLVAVVTILAGVVIGRTLGGS